MRAATKRHLILVGALVGAGALLGTLALGGIESNLVYFWDVSELLAKGTAAHGASVRLGGVVRTGSLHWDPEKLDLQFDLGMDAVEGAFVAVVARAAPPQMFREGIGAVLEGRYDGAIFRADRVIAKHSNEYRPPAKGERPQDLYKTLVQAAP
jgi:cytochrome c-type biogenesis protein CcmE